MELKPGYKQTDVGVIPEDWDVVEYNHIGQIIDGDRGVHYPSSGELKDAGCCLFLNAGNVTKSGFRFEDCTFITKEKDEKLNKGKLKRYDVVLTTRGTVGNFAYFDESVNHENVRINSGMVILRNTSKYVDTKYQYVVLRSRVVGLQIERMAFGSAQPQLTVKGINLFKIPLPPTIAEQTAIANTLSDADALIQSLTRLIAKKRQIKQSAMQTLLNPYENGHLKTGWEVNKLSEIGEIVTGSTPSTQVKEYWNGEIPWITPTDITNEKNIFVSEREISATGLKTTRKLPANTLLVTCIASIGKNAILRKTGACNQQINAIIPDEKINVDFLYYLMENSKQHLLSKAGITATLILSKKEFSEMPFAIPLLDEQTRIATLLSDMDAEIAMLETKLAKYRHIKQGMMQNLLTGRIRLVKPESNAGAVA